VKDRRSLSIVALFVLSILWLSAGPRLLPAAPALSLCDKDAEPLEGDREMDSVISIFEKAYRQRDIVVYAALLHEEFRFEFIGVAPDGSGRLTGKCWLGKHRDVTSTQAMFGDPRVVSIEMDLERIDPNWHPGLDLETGLAGFSAVFIPMLEVTLESEGRTRVLACPSNTYLDIVIVADARHPDGWGIISIREITASDLPEEGSAPVQISGWSSIKAEFDPAAP
jgi:hypothetical protein